MYLDPLIREFEQKFVEPLTADITRTLEVTCHKSGEDNHGSNFIGNAVVLIGIEAAAQFTSPGTQNEENAFRAASKEQYSSLTSEQKTYLSSRHSKHDGSQLAKQFMKNYFGEWFNERGEFGAPLHELIWAFRNPHAHAFYPYYRRRFNGKEISGAVDWLYKDVDQRTGVTIAEVDAKFDELKANLYKVEGARFRICPQILFVFFKRALARFVEQVRAHHETQAQFIENYSRLSGIYDFEPTQA